jgi:DNA-binding XRE family transcriptional regulator
MRFGNKIKQLRDNCQLPQRQLAAELEIDTATYCKIERGERRAKREQVLTLAKLFKTPNEELLNLWLADQVYSVVKDEENAEKVLDIVLDSISEYKTAVNKLKS